MRLIRSSLKGSGFTILIVAGVNLFLLLCMCVLLTSYRPLRHGVNISPSASHFVIHSYDRSLSHIITVAPGETPRFFLENDEISGGMDGIESLLSSWDRPIPSHVTVIIVCDEAVAVGSVQQLVDRILSHGFTCAFFGRPASDE